MHAGPQQDALAIAQNGGLSGQEADDGDLDGETEVDMDDDMMDKISSSPSIEDGGSTFALPRLSPSRSGPLSQSATLRRPLASPSVSDPRSSSPYLESPDHLPLKTGGQQGSQRGVIQPSFPCHPCHHHHLPGEFEAAEHWASIETCSIPDNLACEDDGLSADGEDRALRGTLNERKGTRQRELASPQSTLPGHGEEDNSNRTREDDDNDDDYDDYDYDDDLTVPYDSAEDDDGDNFVVSDARFIDSGWGGECLQETEDIDFEFVYALHTFVATVEGQANATKGDTMVLLDDSNSYWWLVRVVKDSSIGGSITAPLSISTLISTPS